MVPLLFDDQVVQSMDVANADLAATVQNRLMATMPIKAYWKRVFRIIGFPPFPPKISVGFHPGLN
jgi:hypothetical protein